jgi:hypothetical protein
MQEDKYLHIEKYNTYLLGCDNPNNFPKNGNSWN